MTDDIEVVSVSGNAKVVEGVVVLVNNTEEEALLDGSVTFKRT
jgi:hypothetical protein